MKKFMKVFFSFVIAVMMALSMFSVGTKSTVVNAEDPGTTNAASWTVSKSKTAANGKLLDENKETQISLSLPAKDEQLTSDVLFVMDISSCAAEAETVAEHIFSQLDAQISTNKALVNVGLVVFKGNAVKQIDLEPVQQAKVDIVNFVTNLNTAIAIDDTNRNDVEKNKLMPGLYCHRTNLPAGLACAEEVLANSNDNVPNSRKHMVLVSDGATYLFCKDSSATVSGYDYSSTMTRVADYKTTNMYLNDKGHYEDGTLSEWNIKYATAAEAKLISDGKLDYARENAPKDWAAYLAGIESASKAKDYSVYDVNYKEALENKTMYNNIMPMAKNSEGSFDAVINADESFYQANKIYQKMKASGIDCHAYTTGKDVAPFTSFMDYLAGGTAQNILTVGNEIFYMLGAGSTVVDYMGNGGTGDTAYKFSFVKDVNKLVLTVGEGNSQMVFNAALGTNKLAGEAAEYLFTNATVTTPTGKDAPYVLHYYDGRDGSDERIVWEINENVSEFARVQLTYSEKLVTFPTAAASDPDPLNTNGSTVLKPVDSNGNSNYAEDPFVSPTVNYGTVTATAYTGTYDGIEHTISAVKAMAPYSTLSYSTVAPAVAKDTDWSPAAPTVTDAGIYTVYVRAQNALSDSIVAEYKVIINPKAVTLTSGSASKDFDGNPLVDSTVKAEGFVAGEGAVYTVTGGRTLAGSSDNTFTYTLNANTKATNYTITKVNGKLIVNRAVTPVTPVEPTNDEPDTTDTTNPRYVTPRTGDPTNAPLTAGIMIGSLALAAFVFLTRKKYSN